LEDWQVATTNESQKQPIPDFTIESKAENTYLNLKLNNLKPVVLQGEQGLSKKGPQTGNASYYYSLTRLKTTGKIQIDNKQYEVDGFSWLDREWSTSALGENQVGWDWFSLQLDNNIEIMYYQIRQINNKIDPLSKGSFVFADGNISKLKIEDVKLEITNYWQSPLGGRYPSGWKMKIPKHDIELNIVPVMKNQELDVSIRYWEGAVEIDGDYHGKPISGRGYVELTGYAEDKQ
jgi:predicted secreted hydrolase